MANRTNKVELRALATVQKYFEGVYAVAGDVYREHPHHAAIACRDGLAEPLGKADAAIVRSAAARLHAPLGRR